jgi:enamine deaminase RidA (YjgF/YER057c/UK114 family)
MSRIEERLQSLDLALPPAKAPVANYLGTKRSGDLLFVSGRVSALRGEVGSEVAVAEAKAAARDTALELLTIIKQDIGDLDRIASVERVHGFVRSARDFTRHPEVVDGASDLLVALFGEAGRHARHGNRRGPAAVRRRGAARPGAATVVVSTWVPRR